MPEIVRPGENGQLVDSDDADELAAAIAAVLDDDEIYRRTEKESAEVIARYQWSRAADDVMRIVDQL